MQLTNYVLFLAVICQKNWLHFRGNSCKYPCYSLETGAEICIVVKKIELLEMSLLLEKHCSCLSALSAAGEGKWQALKHLANKNI